MGKSPAVPRRALDVPKFGCLNCGMRETQALLDRKGGIYTKCAFCHRINLGIDPQLLAVYRFLGGMLDNPSFRSAWERVRLLQVVPVSHGVPADAATPVAQPTDAEQVLPGEPKP